MLCSQCEGTVGSQVPEKGQHLPPSTSSKFDMRNRVSINLKGWSKWKTSLSQTRCHRNLTAFPYGIWGREERVKRLGESSFQSSVHKGTENSFNPRPEIIWIQGIIWETGFFFPPVLKLLGKAQEKLKKMIKSFPLLNNLFAFIPPLLPYFHSQSCNEL